MKIGIDFSLLNEIDDYALIINDTYNVLFKNEKIIRDFEDTYKKRICYQTIYDENRPCSERGLECPVKIIKEKGLKKYSTIHTHKENGNEKKFFVSTYKIDEGGLFLEMFFDISKLEQSKNFDIGKLRESINAIPRPIVLENSKVAIFNESFIHVFDVGKRNFNSLLTFFKEKYQNEKLFEYLLTLKVENKPCLNGRFQLDEDEFLEINFVPVSIDDNQTFYIWIVDITKDGVEHSLKESEELFRTLAETSAAGIFLHKGTLLYVNPALCEITEYTKEELLNMNALELIHPDFKKKVKELILKRLKGDKTKQIYEAKIITKTGKEKWVQIASSSVFYKGGFAGIGTVIDITEKKEFEEKLKKLATYDSLTGLYNRYMIEEFLEKEIEKSKRHNVPLSVIMCDIDNFKQINDQYGHLFGDKVLKEVASLMKNNIRKSDALGRWGGEEFVIIAPYTDKHGALSLAEKIRKLIEELKVDGIDITISCGLGEFRYSEVKKDFLKRVDEALYLAKKKGKNRVEVAS